MGYKLAIKDKVLPLFLLVTIIVVWELASGWMEIPAYVLPKPSEIFWAFKSSFSEVMANLAVTFQEALLGAIFGSGMGFLTGVIMAQNKTIKQIMMPYVIASNAIPVVAIAPLITLWFGDSLWSRVVVSAFISFFPLAINTFRGLVETNRYFVDLFKLYGASKLELLFKYKLPNAVPFLFTGLKLSATLSVIGAMVAEFISSTKGLGYGLLQALYMFNSAKLWVYIILACAIGLFFYFTITIIETIFFKHFQNSTK